MPNADYPQLHKPYNWPRAIAVYDATPHARLAGIFWDVLSVELGKPAVAVSYAFKRRGFKAKVQRMSPYKCACGGRKARLVVRCKACRKRDGWNRRDSELESGVSLAAATF